MSLILKQVFAFIQLLNSDQGLNSLAFGLAFGVILGFSPFLSIQTFIVLFICFVFRVQLGAAFLSAFFFKFVAYLIDPLADQLGRSLLETPSLVPLWTSMYNMPLVPYTRFNNSIVMGSGAIGFALVIPLFFVFRALIQKYRVAFVARFKETKVWKVVQSTKLYQWVHKGLDLYGGAL